MHHPTKVLSSGGLFSTPKVNYSKETQDLVNVMMKESHLTNLQRNGFNSILRSGDSLPSNSHEMMKQRFQMRRKAMGKALGLIDTSPHASTASRRNRKNPFPPTSGRRTFEQIKASGAYEPTPQRPYVPVTNKDKEISRLQYQMTYGSKMPPESSLLKERPKEKSMADEKAARLAELVDEIGDRIEFLRSMNQIGRDKVYRSMIEFQIREKLNELEAEHPNDITQVVNHFGLHKFMTKIELP